MGFTEINMVFSVRILNNDKIKLNINELNYEVFFNAFEIAKGKMDSVKNPANKNDLLLDIPVKLQLLSLKKSITDMMKKGEINYDIHLHINVNSAYGDYILPLDKTGTTKIY